MDEMEILPFSAPLMTKEIDRLINYGWSNYSFPPTRSKHEAFSFIHSRRAGEA